MKGKRIYQHLYFQVLAAIAIGVLLGYFYPETGAEMKPLGQWRGNHGGFHLGARA
jgi:aerobic C4-dicarboxylate transport protein